MKQHNNNQPSYKVLPQAAIVGIGCFFPRAANLRRYWRLLYHGVDAITEVPESHWSAADYYDLDPDKPDHLSASRGGFLSPVAFDPSEFGIPPNSLEATDSSQILGLLAAKAALADAGYGLEGKGFDHDRTSVILGVTGTQELVIPLGARLGHPIWRRSLEAAGVDPDTTQKVIEGIAQAYVPWQENSFPGLLGNVVAGRISNRLDLGGTNCVVDAACASSLGAVHMALLELQTGRCDMVLTGGVDTLNDVFMHMCFNETRILSPTGDVRPFSEKADGTLLGEGVGIVVLKRVEDARRDGDRIYAVIKAMGATSDGRSQSIYAPSQQGQVKAIKAAYQAADIHPDTVELVEAHGTGTRVGDQTEMRTLKEVFGGSARDGGVCEDRCALGAVKSMIGHTKAAAGTAGMIKAALALHHNTLPPTLKAVPPDPKLDIDHSPFYLNTQARPWFSRNDHPRRCGVSAFGFGGSNFHLLLEEAPVRHTEVAWDESVEIVAISADSPQQLEDELKRWQKDLINGLSESDQAQRASQSRANFKTDAAFRLLWVVDRTPDSSAPDLKKQLVQIHDLLAQKGTDAGWIEKDVFFGRRERPGKLAFMFPGQGSQYVEMGKDLVCAFPEAMQAMEDFNRSFEGERRLTDAIYPCPVSGRREKMALEEALRKTNVAQPAIGAVSVAMLDIMGRFGLSADATCGHSYGELPALFAAGRLKRADLRRLSIARGQLMAAAGHNAGQDPGTMLAVKAPLEDLEALVAEMEADVVLANRNSPTQGVLSGATAVIEQAAKACEQKKYKAIHLPVAAAFHSRLVAGAQKPFQALVDTVEITPSVTPVMSNTTGAPYPDSQDQVRRILGGQLANPVDFVGNVRSLYENGVRTFVEIGPKTVLTGLIRAILRAHDHRCLALDASGGKSFGMLDLARSLCDLAALGYNVAIDRWGVPPTGGNRRKPLMNVAISGANYRIPPTAGSPSQTETNRADDMNRNDSIATPAPKPASVYPNRPATATRQSSANPTETQPAKAAQNRLKPVLDLVQEGLQAIQALQQQTTRAHERYLETQAEANKTLQRILDSAQLLATGDGEARISSPSRQTPAISSRAPKPPSAVLQASDDADRGAQETLTALSATVARLPSTGPTGAAFDAAAGAVVERETLAQTLVAVVADLTGYPAQSIDLHMSIESDLGIDSIKRVEILSTLEERLPDLPAISPERMGDLKTLSQIIDELLAHRAPVLPQIQVSPDTSRPGVTGKVAIQPSAGLPGEQLESGLIEVVSELTGYPVDALNLDMNIESDLGIDSIKRVEILSSLEERFPGLPAFAPEEMGNIKTLHQILERLQPDGAADCRQPRESAVADVSCEQAAFCGSGDIPQLTRENAAAGRPVTTPAIERYALRVSTRQLSPAAAASAAPEQVVYVTDDNTPLAKHLVQAFEAQGIAARLLARSAESLPSESAPGGLVLIAPVSKVLEQDDMARLFLLGRSFARQCQQGAPGMARLFATLTRLDGQFGLSAKPFDRPVSGALAGLAKTARQEWPHVRSHALDLAPEWDPQTAAQTVVETLLDYDVADIPEIGLTPPLPIGSCHTPVLVAAPMPDQATSAPTPLFDDNDLVVVSGGARGIAAACVTALARQSRGRFVVLGRSPRPVPEPEWLAPLGTPADIKAAIFKNGFDTHKPKPIQLDQTYQKWIANREIQAFLDDCAGFKSYVEYHSVDVRDHESLETVLASLRERLGSVTALVHAAGVLEDRYIVEKSREQFERVFATKVQGLTHLLHGTRNDPLRRIVLFSSVSARFGNAGQADYAMANEALNKIAQFEAHRRDDCRVVSINWGPWHGGMVTENLQRQFRDRGVALIPMEKGVSLFGRELSLQDDENVEIVIGGLLQAPIHHDQSPVMVNPPGNETMALAFDREVDLDNHPVLGSHVIDGKPVVPFALMTEWLCLSALHENPGLMVRGMDDLRLLKGIRLNNKPRHIRLLAGKARPMGDHFQVPVEIRDGYQNGKEVIHSRGRAILGELTDPTPTYEIPPRLLASPYDKSVEEVYRTVLFHGDHLKGIRAVRGLNEYGIVAEVATAPPPQEWIVDPVRSQWIADPMALDAAFQIASLWCFEQHGMVSLPSYAGKYRQYQQFPKEGLLAVLEIEAVIRNRMAGDITFVNARGEVVARIDRFEAVMDISLNRAFKPEGQLSVLN